MAETEIDVIGFHGIVWRFSYYTETDNNQIPTEFCTLVIGLGHCLITPWELYVVNWKVLKSYNFKIFSDNLIFLNVKLYFNQTMSVSHCFHVIIF